MTTTRYVVDGLINQNQLDTCVVFQATEQMVEALFLSATRENGWSLDLNVGSYGTNYALRAAVAKFGFGANIPADAVYMHAIQAGGGRWQNRTDVPDAP